MADYNPLGRTGAERDKYGDHRGVSIVNHKGTYTQFTSSLDNTAKELTSLLLTKHSDYGPKNISDSPGGALNGLRVRLHDKLARLNNLVDSGVDPKHESLEDTFKDMANYAIIGLLVLRGQWDNK
jgi:hypothetical protein